MNLFDQLKKYPVLTKEELNALIVQSQQPDVKKALKAKNKLINHNLRLVISIAKVFKNRGVELEDLMQEGILGLSKSIDKFDLTKDVCFSTYATTWIKQTIRKAIDRSGTVRLPSHLREKLYTILKTVKLLSQQKQRMPTIKEVSKSSGLSEEVILNCYTYFNKYKVVFSFDALWKEDTSFLDFHGALDSRFEQQEIDDLVTVAVESLDSIEQQFVVLYFYEGFTIKQACKYLGIYNFWSIKKEVLDKCKKKLT
jgi:RNA polymerase sigma factor (sigma-70 family)